MHELAGKDDRAVYLTKDILWKVGRALNMSAQSVAKDLVCKGKELHLRGQHFFGWMTMFNSDHPFTFVP